MTPQDEWNEFIKKLNEYYLIPGDVKNLDMRFIQKGIDIVQRGADPNIECEVDKHTNISIWDIYPLTLDDKLLKLILSSPKFSGDIKRKTITDDGKERIYTRDLYALEDIFYNCVVRDDYKEKSFEDIFNIFNQLIDHNLPLQGDHPRFSSGAKSKKRVERWGVIENILENHRRIKTDKQKKLCIEIAKIILPLIDTANIRNLIQNKDITDDFILPIKSHIDKLEIMKNIDMTRKSSRGKLKI